MVGIAGLEARAWRLVLIGESRGWLGCSLYLREIVGREDGAPPPVDLAAERRNGEFVLAQIGRGRSAPATISSDGGLAVAVAEMAWPGGIGAALSAARRCRALPAGCSARTRPATCWRSRPRPLPSLLAAAEAAGVLAREVGRTGGDALTSRASCPYRWVS